MTTTRTTTKPPPVIKNRSTEFKIAPFRNLTAGDEADVHFPGKRKSYLRAKFLYATGSTLVFKHPLTGGMVGVLPDKVGTIHNRSTPKLRS